MVIVKNLGRVVILSLFFCGLDRVWFFYVGCFLGFMFGLLFICFGDYVMGMESYGGDFMKEYCEYVFLGYLYMFVGVVFADNVRRVEVLLIVFFLKMIFIFEEYGMCFY